MDNSGDNSSDIETPLVALDVKHPPIRAHQPLGGNRNPPSGGAEESQNSSAPGDGEDGEIYSLALDGDGVTAWPAPITRAGHTEPSADQQLSPLLEADIEVEEVEGEGHPNNSNQRRRQNQSRNDP